MALLHSRAGEVIPIGPLGDRLAQTTSYALLKTDALELMRLVLRAGAEIPSHAVDAEATLQGLEGRVEVTLDGRALTLRAGELVVVPAGSPYALRADEDASLLLTLLLPYRGSASATSPG